MRGKLMWIGWVSGSTLLQGTNVVMSVFIFNGTSGRGKFVRKLYLVFACQNKSVPSEIKQQVGVAATHVKHCSSRPGSV
eukprot:1161588-Pelagomonas_calceolata.AAC.2